jgi:IS5 family transposase
VNVDQVADSLTQERTGMTRELLAPLEQNEVERFLGAKILVDQLLDLAQELSVLQDRQLDVEYRRLLGTGMLLRPCSNLLQSYSGLRQRGVEALDLFVDRFVGDDAMAHVRDFPAEEVD